MRHGVAGALWLLPLILRCGAWAMGTDIVPTSQPISSMDEAQLERGQQVRQILLDTMDECYANDGVWPEHPTAKDGRHLVYARPKPDLPAKTLDAMRQASLVSAVTVVLHEPIEEYPSGVWVGYEDGHLEFAATADDLSACQQQRQWALDPAKNQPATQPAPIDDAPLTLKLLDPDEGKPVAGAAVGVVVQFPPDQKGSPISPLREHDKAATVSDDRGEVLLSETSVFQYKFSTQPEAPLIILDQSRQLVGRVELRRDDFGRGKVREIHLFPTCHVHGQLTSLGLAAAGKTLDWANTIVFQPGQGSMYTMNYISKSADFDFPLPPGTYGIRSYGTDCGTVYHYFQIEPGQRQLNLHLDLPADVIFQLIGHSAPELKSIKGWKNGGPVQLSGLHGKVVLLDFWGYWCGPCIGSMPALMKLQDEFKDKGLVIIAVHDDSVESIAEMDQKLASVRNESWAGWGGRDLPFLVALDGGGPTRIKYSGVIRHGATNAEYGINGYPTSLLIGRGGKVIGQIDVRGPEARSQIQKAIDEK